MYPKEYPLVPLFETFIKDSYKGRRLKADGSKIKLQTVDNYRYVLRYLQTYQIKQEVVIRIKVSSGNSKKYFMAERSYWKRFYFQFTQFLYTQLNCYDNYVGTVIKTIRVFFNYLNKEKGIITGDFYKSFYVCKEEIPIVTLLPDQLRFLISDTGFQQQLTASLQKAKAIFVFGCTVALRVSDLFSIKFTDL